MVRDINQFTKVAKTYTAAAPDLLAALNNFTTGSKTLAQQRGQFVDLLRTVTVGVQPLADFTSTNSQDLIDLSHDSLPRLQVLAHYSSEFPCLSRALVDFIPVMDRRSGRGRTSPACT